MAKLMGQRKRQRLTRRRDMFDELPDDLVVLILAKLSSSASCPSDFINILLTCRRLNNLALQPFVLSKAATAVFSIKAYNWCDSAHRFLRYCVNAGNLEACYMLGMIQFYCLQNQRTGVSLLARASIKRHAQALYSLAIIQFNGSGGCKRSKDIQAGVALCARAALFGHADALRELGHCLQDGYGVQQNVQEARRLLVQANARELAFALTKKRQPYLYPSSLLSDFGCYVPEMEAHPANKFMKEWFEIGKGELGQNMRVCSYEWCGRPETRVHEFRRCSVCGLVNYCSRGCQALDWKVRHRMMCVRREQWNVENGVDGGDGEIGGMVEVEEGVELLLGT